MDNFPHIMNQTFTNTSLDKDDAKHVTYIILRFLFFFSQMTKIFLFQPV